MKLAVKNSLIYCVFTAKTQLELELVAAVNLDTEEHMQPQLSKLITQQRGIDQHEPWIEGYLLNR